MQRTGVWLAVAVAAVSTILGAASDAAGQNYAVGINASTRSGTEPLAVTFRLTQGVQRGGRIVPARVAAAKLDYGDGSRAATVRGFSTARHTYRNPGIFTARLTVTLRSGETITSSTRIRVRAARPPNPRELLRVRPKEGLTPFNATFRVGGTTLSFPPRQVRIDFGDGTSQAVRLLSDVTHRYERPGTYRATLMIRGDYSNRARARVSVKALRRPRLRLLVVPRVGMAPLQVTVRAAIPHGQIRSATVMFSGRPQPIMTRPGTHTELITEPGTYKFILEARTSTGEILRKEAEVRVFKEDISGLYRHNGGVVRITAGTGSFSGTLIAPSVAQVEKGYDIGELIVRGVHADAANSYTSPVGGGRVRRYYNRAAEQISEGEYHVRTSPDCEPQWADYRFRVDFGQRQSAPAATAAMGGVAGATAAAAPPAWVRPPSITGRVQFR